MKKLLLIFVVVWIGFPALQAQEFNFGAKAGVNFADITGDNADGDVRTSFHLGLVAEIPFAEKFYFGPEVLYSSQGTKDGDDHLKLDYIQIPLMARYYVSEGFNFELGPQLGFLVKADAELDGETEDVKDLFKDFEYGINFGLGYKLTNGLFFQGRYNLGLANINDFEEFDDSKIHNSVIQFSVGFMF
jgi:hypothetical protein